MGTHLVLLRLTDVYIQPFQFPLQQVAAPGRKRRASAVFSETPSPLAFD